MKSPASSARIKLSGSRRPPSPSAARRIGALTLALALGGGAALSHATLGPIDGIGLIDYDHPPDFRVGSWVKYHVTGRNLAGPSDDYTVTVVIAGEEEFWGEKCFWVETSTENRGQPPRSIATLMSYDAFKDPYGWQKMQYYMRKNIATMRSDGQPDIQIVRIPKGAYRKPPQAPGYVFGHDTLGADTVTVPRGRFDVQVYRLRTGSQTQKELGDSTLEEIELEDRTTYMSLQVPITHMAKEVIDHRDTRRTWLTGQSSQATPEVMFEHAVGEAVLVDYGEGKEGFVVPKRFRRPLAEQAAASAPAPAPPAAPAASKPKTPPRPPSKP